MAIRHQERELMPAIIDRLQLRHVPVKAREHHFSAARQTREDNLGAISRIPAYGTAEYR